MSVMGQGGQVTPEETAAQARRTAAAGDQAAAAGLIAPEVLVRFWPELFGLGVQDKRGEHVPGRAVRVDRTELATHLLAVPLFTLARDGAAQVHNVDRRLLGVFPRRHVYVQPAGAGAAADGLAAALLAQQGEGPEVRALVRRWFQADQPDPAAYVVTVVDQTALQQGLYTLEQPPPHRAGLLGRTVASAPLYHPIPDRVAGTRDPAERLAAQWREFGQRDPQVRDRLLARVRRGIVSRKESDNDGPDISSDSSFE